MGPKLIILLLSRNLFFNGYKCIYFVHKIRGSKSHTIYVFVGSVEGFHCPLCYFRIRLLFVFLLFTLPAFTCSKLTMETAELRVKSVQS